GEAGRFMNEAAGSGWQPRQLPELVTPAPLPQERVQYLKQHVGSSIAGNGGSALVGGLVAGVTWQTASWAFAYYVGNMGNYNAVYSGFAILIFLLIWFYVCWMVLLLGCHVSFLLQHPEFLMRRQLIQHMGGRLREHLALLIMALVGRNFIEDRPPWRAASLVKHTHLPPGHVYHVIDRLIEHGYLVEAGLSQSHLMPERDLASMPLKNLLRDIRSSNAELRLDRREQHPHSQVAGLMQRLQNGQEEVLGNMTVRDLALQNQTDNP
ncbi:MAG: YihY/virulence factor BrkB family protein, partial [Nevskiales bacterium]